MSKYALTRTRIRAGRYEARLTGGSVPDLAARHGADEIAGLRVTPDQDAWNLRLDLTADLLNEGLDTVTIIDRATGDVLDSFSIVTAGPHDEDLRAEVDLLRAELDMLKRAFRRHCRDGETGH